MVLGDFRCRINQSLHDHRATLLQKLIRIQTVGQCQDSQIHILSEKLGERPFGRILPRLVTVVNEHHRLREPLQQCDVRLGQSRSERRHCVHQARLLQLQAIGVPLSDEDRLGLLDRLVRPVQSEAKLTLVEDGTLITVQVFGSLLPLMVRQDASPKRHSAASFVVNWKQHPIHETILVTATIGSLRDELRSEEQIIFKLPLGPTQQPLAIVR